MPRSSILRCILPQKTKNPPIIPFQHPGRAVVDFVLAPRHPDQTGGGGISHEVPDGGALHGAVVCGLEHKNRNCNPSAVLFLTDEIAGIQGLVSPAIAGTAVLKERSFLFFYLIVMVSVGAGGAAILKILAGDKGVLAGSISIFPVQAHHNAAKDPSHKGRDSHRDS